jgi:rhodanese-related sulfurtransferase
MTPSRTRTIANFVILTMVSGLVIYLVKYTWSARTASIANRPVMSASAAGTNTAITRAPKLIKAAELKNLLDHSRQQIVILDIQDRQRFKQEHLKAALNIPSDELEVRAQDELRQADMIVMVDCACDGTNSESLLRGAALMALGFERVVILDEGLNAWKSAGFAVISEPKQP